MAKIILLEDDFSQLRLYSKFLTSAGYQVWGVVTPQELMSVIEFERFDLCISDVNLGYVRPNEWISKLGTIYKRYSLPILMISGDLSPHIALMNSLGIENTLSKPFDKSALLEKIEHILGAFA